MFLGLGCSAIAPGVLDVYNKGLVDYNIRMPITIDCSSSGRYRSTGRCGESVAQWEKALKKLNIIIGIGDYAIDDYLISYEFRWRPDMGYPWVYHKINGTLKSPDGTVLSTFSYSVSDMGGEEPSLVINSIVFKLFEGVNIFDDISLVSNQSRENEIGNRNNKPLVIAVYELTGKNISSGEASALTDRLSLELANLDAFKVIEREMIEQILVEQGFQQLGCTTNECMVEVGKLIGVEQMIGGSISKVGNTFSVAAKIIDVETGELTKTAIYDYSGNIDILLTKGMRKVAIDLAKTK